MTPEEARAELMKRFPNQTVLAESSCWYFSTSKKLETTYYIKYNFDSQSCHSIQGNSFEECLSRIDEERKEINEYMKKYSILLRQFIL